jgi:hypothetical protein
MNPRCWPPFSLYFQLSILRVPIYVFIIHLLSLDFYSAANCLLIFLWTLLRAHLDPFVPLLLHGILALPTCILPPGFLEIAEFLSCFYVISWTIAATILPPKNVSYVPKGQRSSCYHWIPSWLKSTNEVFEKLASFIDRFLPTPRRRHRRCAPASRDTSHRTSTAPRHRATTILALCLTLGIARAHTHCDNSGHATANRAVFDSDSFDILVDGGATASISNDLNDFIIPPRKTKIRIKGFNGTSSEAKVGTVKWAILDDSGKRHILKIPGTYYVPSCPLRLLSPQHYSQQLKDHRGTYSTNYGDQVVFVWDHSKNSITMPLSKSSNVGILRSAPGSRVFSCYVDTEQPPKQPPPDIFACQVITDDEADNMEDDFDDETTVSSSTTGSGGGPSFHLYRYRMK